MKDYKINFDLGKIEYFDNNCLIQVYKFISFYDICEMVFAFHLPPDELITNVIFKEKINSMLKCYIDRLLYVFINPTHFTEKVNLQFYGSFSHMNLFVVKLETFLKIKV
ncbi:Uncharacterised protein [Streptococcus pneumoniae]|nr:Uncharacterised protein [Streptococcus pneumoniae]COC80688.1 Uncharacterised protein [Streptococcus pneumoniae]COG62473.1 Uncharacterised protein [Streptococcus pneumoniae]COP15684.1 Uncharacterised protein [Streptococcus pneumoniae]VPR21118.1 Uncharacterised protein [Streptococcus pneumoniae]